MSKPPTPVYASEAAHPVSSPRSVLGRPPIPSQGKEMEGADHTLVNAGPRAEQPNG